MAQSFSIETHKRPRSSRQKRTVLVTGAAGNIGAYFCAHSHRQYKLVMLVHTLDDDAKKLNKFGRLVEGDIGDLDFMKQLCRGVDTVLHLAGDASPNATWESVLKLNIEGAYHCFIAAKANKVRRFIYASSIHAVSGYPADYQVHTDDPVNPGDLYGVSKCFGEALGRYMAEQEGLSTICLRIGGFQPPKSARAETGIKMLDAWVSQRDLNQLIEKCIENDTLRFAIFNGLSDNRFKRLDITDARELVGYTPQDDATKTNPKLKKLKLAKNVSSHSVQDSTQQSGLREELE